MTDANYQKHLKLLGKLCLLYDDANTQQGNTSTLLENFVDQYADGLKLASIKIFSTYQLQWLNALSGNSALANIATAAAAAYLTDPTFTADLTTVPVNPQSVTSVLAALQTEMSAGVDNKTLSTLGSTGLVHFFNSFLPSPGTWNTSGTPSYADGTFVVSAVI